tara:strand:- start:113 stop:310 length:198 start_codon:yes stop_codon:yes gene_type:complete
MEWLLVILVSVAVAPRKCLVHKMIPSVVDVNRLDRVSRVVLIFANRPVVVEMAETEGEAAVMEMV